ncbi:MAG TPA: cysteine-rich CWC family protein [Pseudolabrys sp.]|jgi:hypothetical protein|nr:cysteine-rich CWC family protein [Pseudolabrys sp.]
MIRLLPYDILAFNPIHAQARRVTSTEAAPRRLSCARCGTAFDCELGGDCWCAAEPFRFKAGVSPDEDCLCPACLRQAAEALARKAPPRL